VQAETAVKPGETAAKKRDAQSWPRIAFSATTIRMRIAYTSDIHVDISDANTAILPCLRRAVEALDPDAFVVAGDIANSLDAMRYALSAFRPLDCPKFLVPGNHDLWLPSKRAVKRGEDSWHRYTVAIPALCEANGFHCLIGAPRTLDGVAVIGTVGWYDYSLSDPRLDGVYDAYDYARGEFHDPRHVTGIWNDARFCHWLRDHEASDWHRRRLRLKHNEVFEKIFGLFREDAGTGTDGARAVLAVIHTSPFAECIERPSKPDPFNAYEGSARLGDFLAEMTGRTPVTAICGHRHGPFDGTIDGVRVHRRVLGYLKEFDGDLNDKAAEAVGVVEV